jgi:hypothetical protein
MALSEEVTNESIFCLPDITKDENLYFKALSLFLENENFTKQYFGKLNIPDNYKLSVIRTSDTPVSESNFISHFYLAMEKFNDGKRIEKNNKLVSVITILQSFISTVFINKDSVNKFTLWCIKLQNPSDSKKPIFSLDIDSGIFENFIDLFIETIVKTIDDIFQPTLINSDSIKKKMFLACWNKWGNKLKIQNDLSMLISKDLRNNITIMNLILSHLSKSNKYESSNDTDYSLHLPTIINMISHILIILVKRSFLINQKDATMDELFLVSAYLSSTFKIDIKTFALEAIEKKRKYSFVLNNVMETQPIIINNTDQQREYEKYKNTKRWVNIISYNYQNYGLIIPLLKNKNRGTNDEQQIPIIPINSQPLKPIKVKQKLTKCILDERLKWAELRTFSTLYGEKPSNRCNHTMSSILVNPQNLSNESFFIIHKGHFGYLGNFKFKEKRKPQFQTFSIDEIYIYEWSIQDNIKLFTRIDNKIILESYGLIGSQITPYSCLEKTKTKSTVNSYISKTPNFKGSSFIRVLFAKYSSGPILPITITYPESIEDMIFYIGKYLSNETTENSKTIIDKFILTCINLEHLSSYDITQIVSAIQISI